MAPLMTLKKFSDAPKQKTDGLQLLQNVGPTV